MSVWKGLCRFLEHGTPLLDEGLESRGWRQPVRISLIVVAIVVGCGGHEASPAKGVATPAAPSASAPASTFYCEQIADAFNGRHACHTAKQWCTQGGCDERAEAYCYRRSGLDVEPTTGDQRWSKTETVDACFPSMDECSADHATDYTLGPPPTLTECQHTRRDQLPD